MPLQQPFTVPDAWVLHFFPVLFGVSLIGCIAGTYSAPPTLTIIPMYLVVREQLGLWSSIALLLVTTLILRKTWYKPLCKEEARYNEEMKQLK